MNLTLVAYFMKRFSVIYVAVDVLPKVLTQVKH